MEGYQGRAQAGVPNSLHPNTVRVLSFLVMRVWWASLFKIPSQGHLGRTGPNKSFRVIMPLAHFSQLPPKETQVKVKSVISRTVPSTPHTPGR